ncbi:MAG: DUF72 domain-containing protein [Chitinophagaceae bacterium]
MALNNAALYIGTSNITLPGNKLSFPPEFRNRSRLSYYSSLFNSVEINSSFYKVPLARTFARWASEVPDHFRFTVKLYKGITHSKNLLYDVKLIRDFLESANELGSKKGCLLVQFPKSITPDNFDEVKGIIESTREYDPGLTWGLAAEFRHPGWVDRNSWYGRATMELLDRQQASLVVQDIPASLNEQSNENAAFVYQRFHGVKGDYRGSYTSDLLEKKSTQIREWLANGKTVYAYFNNTMGEGYSNALELSALTRNLINIAGRH